ncbi:hypothetical protein [Halalkalicoccus sp. NIPERK01]|uniref:hypothetical protein n=1 Tax=Halalkalicoccus sp. NIPERK01 TaxID=3053469 RepID=UPI00256F2A9F|nr:hypothetical protein [Halalkalicoccus sp. NIPERK01]MDL5361081.1 hypothetical protein [Halalkalicoccus sp. NIPERK01]
MGHRHERRVRNRLLAAHADLLVATGDRADAVARARSGPATRREDVVEPLTAALERADLLERYPAVLATAAAALGESLPVAPVAAPPYVVVTGTGPVLRASLPSGRLVVRLAVFALERDPRRYVRTGTTPDEILEIERR